MLDKLLVLDGVVAACRFQDDGTIIDHAGILPDETMVHLAQFAHWYRRMVSGNTDLLSLFSQCAAGRRRRAGSSWENP
jgi:roadblock/LC7 domain-containing protein